MATLGRYLIKGLLSSWLSMSLILCPEPSFGQNPPLAHYDALIYVKSQEVKDYLDYPGSPLKPIVKVTVSLQNAQDGVLGEQLLYEDLWYRGPNAIGCRRYRDFELPPKALIYIYLNASSPIEMGGAANTLVRLLVEALLNRDALSGVEVSPDLLQPLVDQFQQDNFYTQAQLPGRPSAYICVPLITTEGKKCPVVYKESW
jgi:hypothetical protein